MRQQCDAFICNGFEALPNAHTQQRLYPQLGLVSRKSPPEGRFLAGPFYVRRQNNLKFCSKARQRLFPGQIVEAACSADLQPFTQWLIENGAEGIHGDQQRVEFYRYGQEGRGLQTTTVRFCISSTLGFMAKYTSRPLCTAVMYQREPPFCMALCTFPSWGL